MHRDSVASEQSIRPGEVNWMIAGRGITHSERFEKARAHGGALHGIQAWVALPNEYEETQPAFSHHEAQDLPTVEHGGVWMRLLAGRAFDMSARVRTLSPLFYLHLQLRAGSQTQLPREYAERALYVVSGSIEVEGHSYGPGHMLVFASGADAVVTSTVDSTAMAVGGEPVGERFIEWNFVASSKDRIEQAKADWRAGRMKLPDLDHDEFMPLPGDPPGTAPQAL
jgi:redox-sensitive bicupin YhaK (pirin superfamily)